MNEILRFEHVFLNYHSLQGETPAISDLSFSVREGEFVSVIGPSGCGKTTLLSLISGLMPASSGKIVLDGDPVTKPSASISYMLQRDQLFPWRSIYKNVTLGLEVKHIKTPDHLARIEDLLKKYGLWEFRNARPRQLSGGMRQRAALIRTLALDPRILLLDEPFSALDYQTRLSVCDDVAAIIASEQKTAVLVTHDISEAISMSDRIFVLSRRPATLKNIYETGLKDFGPPLKRREHPSFPVLFEKIYREIRDDETKEKAKL